MPTYNDLKQSYEQSQSGAQQGAGSLASSARTMQGAIGARDDSAMVDSAAEGVGAVLGMSLGAARRAGMNAKIQAINSAIKKGYELASQGLWEQCAETATRELISSDIVEARVNGYFARGGARLQLDEYEDAVKDFSEAIRLAEKPGSSLDRDALGDTVGMSYGGRGTGYYYLNKPGEALRDLTKAIELTPGWETPYYQRSVVLCDIQEYDQALADINRAIAIKPGDSANYRQRAKVYSLGGAPNKELEDLTRAVVIEKSAANLRARGSFYAQHDQPGKALEDYATALAAKPDDIATLRLRAALLQQTGSETEAQRDLAEIAVIERRSSSYANYLQAAATVYSKGVTKTWTEADARAKPNIPAAVLVGIGVLVGSSLVFALVEMFVPFGPNFLTVLGVLPWVLAGLAIYLRLSNKERSKAATKYLSEIAAVETQLPKFREFFAAYVKARQESTLSKLPEATRALFD
jgi:tetratricopeptide (TPR) repeat protein